MKLKDGLILREVAGQYVVVPTGKRVREISRIHYMSKDAALLWNNVYGIEFDKNDLIHILKTHFPQVTEERAEKEAENFIEGIKTRCFLENDASGTAHIRFQLNKDI